MPTVAMLDDLPKGAWIAVMVLGFVLFWPVGLGVLFYLIWSGKMHAWRQERREMRCGRSQFRHYRTSGNSAFDDYRDQTLKRLEEEQRAFSDFVERLRRAKDQQEFDQFMAERRGAQDNTAGA
ncbi:DUF2852 domain-containing protein [Parvibaculum sp.]|uniref:DUF2852 domain-containing protein n=1 Tax=Parvibaculum sp. TaxID=2024848 RepID=UPI002BDF4D01|nr:DUF2852 domain-containing protein [Parvibaculum sp.]HUD53158.1 DUF2852 domain-containing protein [Parvibaculum sp.]